MSKKSFPTAPIMQFILDWKGRGQEMDKYNTTITF
jgi:hypothetical protein